MADDEENDGLMSRWSRKKRGLVEEEVVVELSPEEEQEILDEREAELVENREAAEAIDLDTIDEESDLSIFMKEGVPKALKKAALAKLWRSSPIFANVDGLVDYDDNFGDPKLNMKVFTSAYQVGRGYLKEVLEDEPEELVAAADADIEEDMQDEVVEEAVEEEVAEASTLEEPVIEEPIADDYFAEEPDLEEVPVMPKVSLRQRLGLYEAVSE